jgi:hypothetical protein
VVRLAAVTVTLALLAGCGEGEKGTSKADFAARADAACKAANDARAALQKRGLVYPPKIEDEKAADLLRELERADRRAMQQLRALTPPDDDTATIGPMLDGFESAFVNFGEFIRAAAAGDDETGTSVFIQFNEALQAPQAAADGYGLRQCARFGNP